VGNGTTGRNMTRIIISIVIILIIVLTLVGCTTTKEFNGLTLINNSQAKDVNSAQLQQFLAQDKTDEHSIVPYTHKLDPDNLLPCGVSQDSEYIVFFDKDGEKVAIESLHEYVTSGYMCANFGVDLHNNAEKAGIRCAVVTIANDEWTAHCVNGFNTTDKGMAYIDAGWGGDSFAYKDIEGNIVIDNKNGDSKEILGKLEGFKVEW